MNLLSEWQEERFWGENVDVFGERALLCVCRRVLAEIKQVGWGVKRLDRGGQGT